VPPPRDKTLTATLRGTGDYDKNLIWWSDNKTFAKLQNDETTAEVKSQSGSTIISASENTVSIDTSEVRSTKVWVKSNSFSEPRSSTITIRPKGGGEVSRLIPGGLVKVAELNQSPDMFTNGYDLDLFGGQRPTIDPLAPGGFRLDETGNLYGVKEGLHLTPVDSQGKVVTGAKWVGVFGNFSFGWGATQIPTRPYGNSYAMTNNTYIHFTEQPLVNGFEVRPKIVGSSVWGETFGNTYDGYIDAVIRCSLVYYNPGYSGGSVSWRDLNGSIRVASFGTKAVFGLNGWTEADGPYKNTQMVDFEFSLFLGRRDQWDGGKDGDGIYAWLG